MTKQELEAYVDELEGVIADALAALENDDSERAGEILRNYVEE